MTQTDPLVECANCSRPVREADAEVLGWRYWSDGKDLHLICSLCATQSSAMTLQPQQTPDPEPTWLLSCGHEVPLLEDERPDDRPRRPRFCPVCEKYRNVALDI